jgi:hypothetical protein
MVLGSDMNGCDISSPFRLWGLLSSRCGRLRRREGRRRREGCLPRIHVLRIPGDTTGLIASGWLVIPHRRAVIVKFKVVKSGSLSDVQVIDITLFILMRWIARRSVATIASRRWPMNTLWRWTNGCSLPRHGDAILRARWTPWLLLLWWRRMVLVATWLVTLNGRARLRRVSTESARS